MHLYCCIRLTQAAILSCAYSSENVKCEHWTYIVKRLFPTVITLSLSSLSSIPRHTAHWCPLLFPLPFFLVFLFSSLLFCFCATRFLMCFLYDRSICIHLLDPLFLTLGEFQAWDSLRYPLTCSPRGRVGVRMEQNS